MHRLISLPSTDTGCVCKMGVGVKSKLVVARGSTGLQRSGQESWYGYYTVLLLTIRYLHELSIGRLLFVYTCTTEGQCKNVGAVVVVIVR